MNNRRKKHSLVLTELFKILHIYTNIGKYCYKLPQTLLQCRKNTIKHCSHVCYCFISDFMSAENLRQAPSWRLMPGHQLVAASSSLRTAQPPHWPQLEVFFFYIFFNYFNLGIMHKKAYLMGVGKQPAHQYFTIKIKN